MIKKKPVISDNYAKINFIATFSRGNTVNSKKQWNNEGTLALWHQVKSAFIQTVVAKAIAKASCALKPSTRTVARSQNHDNSFPIEKDTNLMRFEQ